MTRVSHVKLTRRDERILLCEGFRAVYGVEPSRAQAQLVHATGMLETNCGAGWSPKIVGADESNNWGAITAGQYWVGETFEHKDTYPDEHGVNHPYVTKFRKYPTPAAGAKDLVCVVYLSRPSVLKAARDRDVYRFSAEMYDTIYYKGFGKTREERIGNHHKAVMGCLARIARELKEAPPDAALSAVEISDAELWAYQQITRAERVRTWGSIVERNQDLVHDLTREGLREINEPE